MSSVVHELDTVALLELKRRFFFLQDVLQFLLLCLLWLQSYKVLYRKRKRDRRDRRDREDDV